jgi:hypothetical protein
MHIDKDLQLIYITEVTKKDIMSGLEDAKRQVNKRKDIAVQYTNSVLKHFLKPQLKINLGKKLNDHYNRYTYFDHINDLIAEDLYEMFPDITDEEVDDVIIYLKQIAEKLVNTYAKKYNPKYASLAASQI